MSDRFTMKERFPRHCIEFIFVLGYGEKGFLGLWLEYIVKVDKASEIKNGQVCMVRA